MNSPTNQNVESQPKPAPEVRRLGRRQDIGMVGEGLMADKKRGGKITASLYTGFLDEDGGRAVVKRRTGEIDREKALKKVQNEILPKLFSAYDNCAKALGLDPASAGAVDVAANTPQNQMKAELAFWKKNELYLGSLPGYTTATNGFLHHAGELAHKADHVFAEAECIAIRDKMLAGKNLNSEGPSQTMANLRFVLKRIKTFPRELVKIFKPKRRERGMTETQDFNFLPSDRTVLWANLGQASFIQLGLTLLGANFSVHATDAANATCAQLRELKGGICRGERVKTGNPFNNAVWEITKAWIDKATADPEAIWAFPDFVFGARELAKNPDINRQPLVESEKKMKVRQGKAAAKASLCFDEYLELCKIKRPGISYRSFRHSNISEWDAQGVPRSVGMTATGQSEEKNYLNYIKATIAQLKSLGDLTLDFWQNADSKRRYLLTLNQLCDALEEYIKESERRICDHVSSVETKLLARCDARFDAQQALMALLISVLAESLGSNPSAVKIMNLLALPGLKLLSPLTAEISVASVAVPSQPPTAAVPQS